MSEKPKQYCWRSMRDTARGKGKLIECEMSKCCYDASCQAVFDYWKFAHSDEWKEILRREIEKERKKK